jgi:hypothetical protein
LTLADFPREVVCGQLPPVSVAAHTVSHDAPDRSSMDPRWIPSGVEKYMAPLINSAIAGDKHARASIVDAVQAHAARAPPAKDGRVVDQPRICGQGRPSHTPRNRSSMNPGRDARPGGAT